MMIPTLQLNDTTELISFDWMNNWICLPSVELLFFTADIWTGDGGKSAGVAILINYVCIPACKFYGPAIVYAGSFLWLLKS